MAKKKPARLAIPAPSGRVVGVRPLEGLPAVPLRALLDGTAKVSWDTPPAALPLADIRAVAASTAHLGRPLGGAADARALAREQARACRRKAGPRQRRAGEG